MTPDSLIKIGGKEWKKDGRHNIYFNNLREHIGLQLSFYNTGNISSARLNGEIISNSQAKEICTSLDFGKLWFDVKENSFHYSGIRNNRTFSAQEMFEAIVIKITDEAKLTNKTCINSVNTNNVEAPQ